MDDDDEPPIHDLLYQLTVIARREALNLNLTIEANRGNPKMRDKMLEVCVPFFVCFENVTITRLT